MTGPLTRHGYAELIAGNIAWIMANTEDCLERQHVLLVLEQSVSHEYPEDPEIPPQDVIDDWIKQCNCCPDCHGRPCAGVEAGGMCDNMNGQFCHCDNEY